MMGKIKGLKAGARLALFSAGLAGALGLWSACGSGHEFNLLQPLAAPLHAKESKSKIEAARIDLDKGEYASAAALLEPMVDGGKDDSNSARLLLAAARLGEVQLDIWSIISDFLDSQSGKSSKSSGKGIDALLESLGDSVLGTGAERAAKAQALVDTITMLKGAPDPKAKAIVNTSCILGGILAVPTFVQAKESLAATFTALGAIRDAAQNGGTTCPNIGLLDQATAGAVAAAQQFSLVLGIASSCPFLDLGATASSLNAVQTKLALITKTADKGCASVPSCPSSLPGCTALFPPCVQTALKVGAGTATAGDGVVTSCELVLNCVVSGGCFQG